MPVAEFSPDRPEFMNPGSGLIQNVLPVTQQSYGPFPSAAVASGPLAARCQGAISVRDTAGNARIHLGDSTNLYRMDPASPTPVAVSQVGGYTTPNAERWSFAYFGSGVIATNYVNSPQIFNETGGILPESATYGPLIATGQTDITARYVAVVRDWVALANVTSSLDGVCPFRVWWSAINDPTSFPFPGTAGAAQVQSDFQDLFGEFGSIQGLIGNLGYSHAAVFQEHAVWRMNYQGSPTIFRFDIAEGVRGLRAPGSLCQLGPIAFYLGEDGFYSFDGSTSTPIGFQKVDQFFNRDCNPNLLFRISASVNPDSKTIHWAYPSNQSSDGNCDRVLSYHWGLDRWTVTAPGDVIVELVFEAESFGYTLEQMDVLWPNLDAEGVPSFDDPSLAGGHFTLGGIDSQHRVVTFAGPALAATVDTSEAQLSQPFRSLVHQTRPLVDGGLPAVAMGTRDRLMDPVLFDLAVAVDDEGWCPQRSEARFHRARITLPAGSSFSHIQGIDITAVPAGVR